MVTLFTTAKPFKGHDGIIQRNALKSWKLLGSKVEVILFGNEEGAAEACEELGLRHELYVERNEAGLKRIDYYFDRAQEIARRDVLCYVNCDIILGQDFLRAVEQVKMSHPKFLMIGRRWDTDLRDTIDFSKATWAEEVWQHALNANDQRDEKWIDYFAFSRGLYYKKVPPFAVGRTGWDNWLVWSAANLGASVVDASCIVRAIHQNHDYGYHPRGKEGVWNDEQARQNFQLAGGWNHLWFISDAAWVLRRSGSLARRRRGRWLRLWNSVERVLIYDFLLPIWHFVLDISRPVRRVLGLRSTKGQ
jgi:hypothetical protein